MRNSLRILRVILFRCLVKLFFIVIIIIVATFMVNKDEYKNIQKSQKAVLPTNASRKCQCATD